MRYRSLVLILLLFFNCKEKQSETKDAISIIQKAIQVAGVKKLDSSSISFDFRQIHYVADRNDGKFDFQREFADSTVKIHDYLSNTGFERYLNDSLVTISDSLIKKYAASVNSVHYFAVLPYSLDGKAINKTYLGTIEFKGTIYYKIEVTFNKDGGGEDYDDEFIYWVNTKTSKIDYLAYSYNEDDGRGLRFREAFNERYINGVRFVDYNNYKPKDDTAKLENLDTLFMDGKMELMSKIELENVTVN